MTAEAAPSSSALKTVADAAPEHRQADGKCSFCLQKAVNQTSKRSDVKLVDSDMPGSQVMDMVDAINEGMDTYKTGQEIAYHVKASFDAKYTGPWQCIAGKNFTFKVSHESNHFCHIQMGTDIAVLLFKSKLTNE